MQQILSDTTKIMVDQKNSNNLLYLPLDKLIQSTNPDAASSSGTRPPGKSSAGKSSSKGVSQEEKDAAALRAPDTLLTRDRGDRP